MIASMAREVGGTGLLVGGFYSVTMASLICPPIGIAIAAAGALWLYGKAKH